MAAHVHMIMRDNQETILRHCGPGFAVMCAKFNAGVQQAILESCCDNYLQVEITST